MHRQAAVYKGFLSKDQTSQLTKEKINHILYASKEKLLTVKIVSISDVGVVELELTKFDEMLGSTTEL